MPLFAPLLKPGAAAPDFRLLDQHGRSRDLGNLAGERGLVLLFLASDWLKADQALLRRYVEAYAELQARGFGVAALSSTNWENLHHLARVLSLPFPILFDPCARMSKRFRCMLIPRFVTGRGVIVLDSAGTVVKAGRDLNPNQLV